MDILLGSWPCGLVVRVKALTYGVTWIESLLGDLFFPLKEVEYIYHYPNGSLVEVNNMFITIGRFNPMISKSFPLDN